MKVRPCERTAETTPLISSAHKLEGSVLVLIKTDCEECSPTETRAETKGENRKDGLHFPEGFINKDRHMGLQKV